jgi:hypothetical protein
MLTRTKDHPMRLWILGLAMLLAGCNLGATAGEEPTPGIPTWEVREATLAACQPRTDWPEYTVQRRDNLTRIANVTGSSVDELVAANCLANANRLVVGQTLYVPRLPGNTSNPTGAPGGCDDTLLTTGTDFIVINPALRFDGECYTLPAGGSVTLSWPDAPTGTTQVTFYRVDALGEEVLGIDATAFDGFTLTWSVPADLPPSAIVARSPLGASSDPVGVYAD